MKKTALMAIVLIAIAAIFSFSAVSADKPEEVPADGPFDEIYAMVLDILGNVNILQMSMDENFTDVDSTLDGLQTDLNAFQADVDDNFTDVDSALDGLQTNVTQIQNDVAAFENPEYIMYSEYFVVPWRGVGPGIPPGYFSLWAPDLDETISVEVKTWEVSGSDPVTLTNTMVCGDGGYVTLHPGEQYYLCPFTKNSTQYLLQIIVPADQREEVTFMAVGASDTWERWLEPGDFKVDPLY